MRRRGSTYFDNYRYEFGEYLAVRQQYFVGGLQNQKVMYALLYYIHRDLKTLLDWEVLLISAQLKSGPKS